MNSQISHNFICDIHELVKFGDVVEIIKLKKEFTSKIKYVERDAKFFENLKNEMFRAVDFGEIEIATEIFDLICRAMSTETVLKDLLALDLYSKETGLPDFVKSLNVENLTQSLADTINEIESVAFKKLQESPYLDEEFSKNFQYKFLQKPKDKKENTILHMAVKENNVPLIFDISLYEHNVSKPNKDGDTALHFAVKHRGFEICEALLQCGINPRLKNKFNQTAADCARLLKKPDLAKLIEEYGLGVDIYILQSDAYNLSNMLKAWVFPHALNELCADNDFRPSMVCSEILNFYMPQIQFIHFVMANRTSTVKYYLRSFCKRKIFAHTASDVTSKTTDPQEEIDMLIDVNMTHRLTKMTPLFVALRNKNFEITKKLLNYGANVNVRLADGTPLIIYALRKNCPMKIIELLITANPNNEFIWDCRDAIGCNLIQNCIIDKNRSADNEFKRLLHLSNYHCLEHRGPNSETLLEMALELNRDDIVRVIREELAELFANPTEQNVMILGRLAVAFLGKEFLTVDEQLTAKLANFDEATRHASWEFYNKFMSKIERIEEEGLILMNASINGDLKKVKNHNSAAFRDKMGFTALIRAITAEQYAATEWLLAQRPALRTISDDQNRFPLHYAYAMSDEDTSDKFVLLILDEQKTHLEILRDNKNRLPFEYAKLRNSEEVKSMFDRVKKNDSI